MPNEGNVWKISSLSINDPKDRFSNEGKILKSMWMLGPSKAVISKGNVTVSGGKDNKEDNSNSDDNKKDNSKESDSNGNTGSSDKETSSDKESIDSKSSSKEGNESFIHSYSILEAFSHLSLMYEKGANKYADNDSGLADLLNQVGGNRESSDNKNSKTSVDGDETTNKKSSEDGENAQDTSNKPKGDEEKKTEEEPKDSFQYGTTYEFMIGIKDEGYTYWKVLIDKRADANAVKAAINNKKFKQAYQIAGLKSETDGLIPVACDTFITKKPGGKKELQPPFIGHCRYAIDAGSEGELDDKDTKDVRDETGKVKIRGARDTSVKEDLTLCLAVAPINGRTKKPDEDVVIQAVYNVTHIDELTGGAIGKLLATAQGAIRDKALGNSDRDYYSDRDKDKDSEESQSEELRKWLHSKFRCVGDHTMYNNFLTLRNFIKKQMDAGNLELESLFVGNKKNGVHEINAQVSTFFKTKKFYTFF